MSHKDNVIRFIFVILALAAQFVNKGYVLLALVL